MILRYSTATCLLILLIPAWAVPTMAADAKGFRFVKEINRTKPGDEEIVSVTLDSDIYDATQIGLGDVRVFDNSGTETPYLIEPMVETQRETVRHPEAVKVVSLEERADTIEVRLQLAEKAHLIRGLTIDTPLKDFVRKVQILGSTDGQEWAPLVTDGRIYDYSRFIDVRQRDLPLPPNDYRHFKLIIDNVTDEKEFPYKELARTFKGSEETQRVEQTAVERRPLRIDRIAGWYEVEQARSAVPTRTNYPVAPPVVTPNSEMKQTIVTIDTRREPLTSFTLQTPNRNFLRRAAVEVQAPRRSPQLGEFREAVEWTSVGGATVFNVQFRTVKRQDLIVPFSEQRQGTYRIVIHNEDNPPLMIDGVQAEGPQYRLIFLAKADANYRVVYGSPQATTPKYDAVSVLAALRESNTAVVATLGPQLANAGYGGQPTGGLGALLNNWYFLGAAIGAMGVVLAWGLFRAGKRLEGLPEE